MVTRLERRAGAIPTPRKKGIIVLVLGLLLGCLCPFTAGAESLQKPADPKPVAKAPAGTSAKLSREAAVRARMLGTYGKLPLRFEANQGQSDARVKFLARARGYSLFLTANEAVMALRKAGATKRDSTVAVLRYRLPGANSAAQISPLGQLPGKSNYLIGKDSTKWHTNIPNYAKVRYGQVYPGVDLVYYGNERRLEFDFEVAPGADPRAIRLAVDGSRQLRLEEQGDLVLETAAGEARLLKPRSYQEVNGKIQTVASRYILEGANTVRFELGAYDRSRILVIDPIVVSPSPSGHPILAYSTYLGGSGYDQATGIAVDASGNAYVAGWTTSSDFPKTEGAYQETSSAGYCAFVTKIAPGGSSLVYSTYLGGSGYASGHGIAVDSLGNAYVTGQADAQFPTTQGAFQMTFGGGELDAYVTKLNPTGSGLVYSTFLGGSGSDYSYSFSNGIAVDSSGSAYVVGITESTNFPTTEGAYDRTCGTDGLCNPGGGYPYKADNFVTKLSADGSALVYSTYLGGSGEEEQYNAIAIDSSGNAYVTGGTHSTDFPTTPGAFQTSGGGIFVTKLNAAGSALAYSTFITTSAAGAEGEGIAVDTSGNAYVTGYLESTVDFPITPGAYQPTRAPGGRPTFVTKLNATGSALVYSTFLGGSGWDEGWGVAVDESGNAYVSGSTNSSDFPTTPGAIQTTLGGGNGDPCQEFCPGDAFMARIDAAGDRLVYSTFLGGTASEEGFSIGLDKVGNAYVVGSTRSTDFPTANPYQAANAGGGEGGAYDAFVAKIAGPSAIRYLPEFKTNTLPGNDNGSTGLVPLGFTVNFFGTEYTHAYVNNNGNITFDEPLWQYTPDDLTSTSTVIIAPFFADVDTRGEGSWQVTYGQGMIDGRKAFGVNWVNVGYFSSRADKLLSAQLILFDRSPLQQPGPLSGSNTAPAAGDFDIEFNYDKVQWETGDANDGEGGLGGDSARAGFSNGTRNAGTYYELPGSAINGAFLDSNTATGLIHNSKDSTNLGRYAFQVRGGAVQGADLAITKTAPGAVAVDGTLTYTLTVVNNGPADVTVVMANDSLPETLNFVSATPSQGVCTLNPNLVVNCNLGAMANEAQATVTIVTTTTAAGQITNTAEVDGNLPDGNPANNTASASTMVGGDLSLSLSPPSLEFEGNLDIICPAKRVTATNVTESPIMITDVAVTGPFKMATDCRGKTLAPGESCVVTVLFLPHELGTQQGTVTISADPNSQSILPITAQATPPCRLQANAQFFTVVRGASSATFTIADSNPSCFTSRVNLSCADQSPATCSFSSAAIEPTQGSVLTVGNLAAVQTNNLNFRVVGTCCGDHSASVNLAVRLSDFSLAVNTPRATVAAGNSTTYDLSLQPVNGLSGRVNLSCSGAPFGATCSVSPTSLAINGATAAPFTVTVTTTARSMGAPGPKPPTLPPVFGRWVGLAGLVWLMALAMLAGRRRRALLGLTVALLFVMLWAACAGGSSPFKQSLTGTPAGTYALTIGANYSASSSGASGGADLTHSTTVTLQVQ